MKSICAVLCLIILCSSGCATQRAALRGDALSPAEAINGAAAHPSMGVSGVFEMTVRAIGQRRGEVFLNSELDYRDQRNLTIKMSEAVAAALADRLGAPLKEVLVGKRIRVRGTARRVQVLFLIHDRPSGKYYYQTHVKVTDPVQIRVVGNG